LNLLKPEIYYHHTNIGMKVNSYYHKMGIPKPSLVSLAEVFKGKPHLERLLKDKPYLKKGNREAMQIVGP